MNKVETGVRAIHIPTGTAVTSTQARSQHMNKNLALNKLCEIIGNRNESVQSDDKQLARLEHARLERGNPNRIYEGLDFRRTK